MIEKEAKRQAMDPREDHSQARVSDAPGDGYQSAFLSLSSQMFPSHQLLLRDSVVAEMLTRFMVSKRGGERERESGDCLTVAPRWHASRALH